jgi:hypothetical protein
MILLSLSYDLDRLKVWAENFAAHRRGAMSMEHRLREASPIKQSVKQLLLDLNDVLEKCKPPWSWMRIGH